MDAIFAAPLFLPLFGEEIAKGYSDVKQKRRKSMICIGNNAAKSVDSRRDCFEVKIHACSVLMIDQLVLTFCGKRKEVRSCTSAMKASFP